jgi:hypothetical protein
MTQKGFMQANERGSVLIATVSVIVLVAGMSLVMLHRSENNVIRYRQDRREVQADYVAEAAMSMMIAKMNNDWLTTTGYPDAGDMTKSSSDDPFIIHSGDSEHEPMEVFGANLRGHPKHDRIDNDGDGDLADDPSDNELVDPAEDDVDSGGYYKGGIYRVQVREWVMEDSGKGMIGAEDIDDDGDGKIDEPGEVNTYTTEDSRQFTIVVEASYGNYTIEMRAFTNANQTSDDKFGMYSEGNLELKSNTYVDSYDSSIGPYGGANVSEDGNIGAEGDMTLKNKSNVYGDGKYGGTLDNNGTIHGEISSSIDDHHNDLWTLTRNFVNPTGTQTVSQGTTETITSNHKRLNVEKNATAVIPDGSVLTFGQNGSGNSGIQSTGKGATVQIGKSSNIYIEESWSDGADTNIVINGPDASSSDPPTKIYIADTFETNNRTNITINGRVEMYVVDRFDLGSKSEVNVVSGNTTDFSVLLGGNWLSATSGSVLESSNGTELRLKPKSDWMGVLYAPYVDNANLFPKGDFFGSLTAQNIDMKSKFQFHYDERISKACNLAAVTCAWVADNSNAWIVHQRGGGPVID